MTTDVLYHWPAAAHFGRTVPKTKFYEHGHIPASTRKRFVDEVQKITWAYKLAESTVNLSSTDAVPEIQVFAIEAKGEDVSDVILTAIDRAVPFPTVFEIDRHEGDHGETRMVSCHKELGGVKPKLSAYFSTPWLPSDLDRSPLPQALDLGSLYSGLLAPMLPVASRAGEHLAESAERVKQTRKLEREIATLQKRLRAEPQFNRKVELRRELKARAEGLAGLTDPAPPGAPTDPLKDAKWTS